MLLRIAAGKLSSGCDKGAARATTAVHDTLHLVPPQLRPAQLTLPHGVDDLPPLLGVLQTTDQPDEAHRLLGRIDSKFELARARLPQLLQALAASHVLLRSAGQAAANYVTLYFDTPDHQFLHDHLRGRRPRHKLRIRHYPERRLSMLEVKTRMPGDRTEKQLRPRAFGGSELSAEERQWATACTGLQQEMQLTAWTSCQRLTLLGRDANERLTVDLNIALGTSGGARSLRDTALIELKQLHRVAESPALLALRGAGVRRVRMSKYVAAMMTAAEPAPLARFKAVLGQFAHPERWGECQA